LCREGGPRPPLHVWQRFCRTKLFHSHPRVFPDLPGSVRNFAKRTHQLERSGSPVPRRAGGQKRGVLKASVFPNSFLLKNSPSVNWAALIWTL